MALLKHTRESPPDDWKYFEAATGVTIKGDFMGELEDRVMAHREYKGLKPWDRQSVSLMIQRQICEAAPPGVCRPEDGEDYRPFVNLARGLNLTQVLSFTSATVEWIKNGLGFAPKAESEARASVCRGCPFNQATTCSCTTFWKMLEALIPTNRVEPDMKICILCGCALRAKVIAPKEAILAEKHPRLPNYCWVSKLIEQSVNPPKAL